MISQDTIQEVVRRLVRAYEPLSIYLFGRYAWGTPDEDDDLELLVIVKSSNVEAYKRGDLAFDTLLSLKIPKTVLILTKEEFDTFAEDKNSWAHEIKSKGKVLYARS